MANCTNCGNEFEATKRKNSNKLYKTCPQCRGGGRPRFISAAEYEQMQSDTGVAEWESRDVYQNNHAGGIANGMQAGLGEPVRWPPGHKQMDAAEWLKAVRRDAIMDKFIITKLEQRRGENNRRRNEITTISRKSG